MRRSSLSNCRIDREALAEKGLIEEVFLVRIGSFAAAYFAAKVGVQAARQVNGFEPFGGDFREDVQPGANAFAAMVSCVERAESAWGQRDWRWAK